MSEHLDAEWGDLTDMELAAEFVWWYTHPETKDQADIILEIQAEFRRRDTERAALAAEVARLRAELTSSRQLTLRLEKAILKHLNGQNAADDFKAILADEEARLAADRE